MMPSMKTKHLDALADTVMQLFEKGNTDPTATEIAAAHWARDYILPDQVKDIRERLSQIRKRLKERGVDCCLVSDSYYSDFRKDPRIDWESEKSQARLLRTVAMGGQLAAGIKKRDPVADPVYFAAVSQNGKFGAALIASAASKATKAKLTDEMTRRFIAGLVERMHEIEITDERFRSIMDETLRGITDGGGPSALDATERTGPEEKTKGNQG